MKLDPRLKKIFSIRWLRFRGEIKSVICTNLMFDPEGEAFRMFDIPEWIENEHDLNLLESSPLFETKEEAENSKDPMYGYVQ